jgi:serine/threonine protein kinase
MEYCSNGTLHQVMANKDIEFTWATVFKMANEIVQVFVSSFPHKPLKGVWCLHSWKPQVVHRDIKSVNLLISDNNVVKASAVAKPDLLPLGWRFWTVQICGFRGLSNT